MAHIEMLVWFDVNTSLTTQTRLKALGPTLYVVSDCNTFIDHITTNATKPNSVLLIVSGFFVQELMPMIDAFPQLHRIYVYCTDANKHIPLAIQCDKIGADRICSQENDLIARLTADLKGTKPEVCNLMFECSSKYYVGDMVGKT
jgi:hypothetical protein